MMCGTCASYQIVAEDHLPLVAAMVRRFPHHNHEPEELYQQGCVGLMKAIARYTPEKGNSFASYACAMIIGEMRMLSREEQCIHIPRTDREKRTQIRKLQDTLQRQLGREPTIDELASALRTTPEELVMYMEDIIVASTDAVSENGTSIAETLQDQDDWLRRLELRDIIGRLPEKDRLLMTYRYLDCLSQQKTAELLGMTQLQVSRRETVIRRQLRDAWMSAT